MLFHVTLTHKSEDCPGYDPAKMDLFLASAEQMEATGKEMEVKIHYFLWAPPAHLGYVLAEAESVAALGRFFLQLPLRQEFTVTPVMHLKEFITMGKAMRSK